MKEKVIFDTNTVRNTEINTFFGGRKELEHFVQEADIIIPFTVIEEIKRQKRVALKSKKESFISNPFHTLSGIKEEETKSFDIDAYIEYLMNNETIPFEVIDLKNNGVLPQIKELALFKKPPFEPNDNTDKGFKDALIYFTVLEYLDEIPNKYIFICAKDNLLGEAFKKHPNVIVIKDYNEFKLHSISQFYDPYFIEKINDELQITITKENIIEYWYNIVENKVVLIEFEGNEFIIETDSGEIISYCNRNDFLSSIDDLVNSNRFLFTHRAIAKLKPFINYLSNEEINRIFESSFANEDIWRIINDQDVKEFIGDLYDSKKDLITNSDVSNFLKENFELIIKS